MAQVKAFSLGGIGAPCCCGGTCTFNICISCCTYLGAGATVSVYTSQGGTLLATGTANSSGCISFSFGGTSGNYWVTASVSSCPSGSAPSSFAGPLTLTCGGTAGIQLCCTGQICAFDCASNYPGVTITIKDLSGTTIISGVTDSTGCFNYGIPPGTYNVTATPPSGYGCTATSVTVGCGTSYNFNFTRLGILGCAGTIVLEETVTFVVPGVGTLTTDATGFTVPICSLILPSSGITISADRFTTVTTSGSGPPVVPTSGCTAFQMGIPSYIESGYICFCNCNIPLCQTLQVTDSVLGALTLTYNPGTVSFEGSLSVPYAGYCDCPAGTAIVNYSLSQNPGRFCIQFFVSVNLYSNAGVADNCPAGTTQVAAGGRNATVVTTCVPFEITGTLSLSGLGCFGGTCGANCDLSVWGGAPSTTLTITDSCP
jgi:hypothetical protein